MRILFVSDNFPPEYNAPATRTFEHCREWVRLGAEVTVITCFPNFPRGRIFDGYKNKWKSIEYVEGIRVIRVWSFISANTGTFKRALDFLSFAFTSFLAGLFIKCDVIVATSPQFFSAVSGSALAFFKRKPWIMEVRDIWPESIEAVNAVGVRWIISVLEKIELFLYRDASRIVVVTDSFKINLTGRGIDANKIFVIKNGVDLSVFKPAPKNQAVMLKHAIPPGCIVGYVGTHGVAHGLDFILQCISKLDDDGFHFVFVGDGAEKKNLLRQAEDLQLKRVTFLDPVEKSAIASYLSIIDIALVPLKKSTTFESVIPSKVFESVAMRIPILLGVNGETRAIIESYKAGAFFEPENETDFFDKLFLMRETLVTDPSYYTAGCKAMADDFNRSHLARQMLGIISGSTAEPQ